MLVSTKTTSMVTQKEKQMMIALGCILIVAGVLASLYEARETYTDLFGKPYTVHRGYPYQTIGIILVLIGAIFIGLGIFTKTMTVTS